MIINQLQPVNHYFPSATVLCYDIIGSTAEDLRAQMDFLGPIDDNGQRYDALTRWHIRWWWPGFGQSPCELNNATVSYEIKVIFPRWIQLKDASPRLIMGGLYQRTRQA
jgi:predicted secreted Zn-dependent protease